MLLPAQETEQSKPAVMRQYSQDEIQNLVDNLMNEYIQQDLFSGVVLIAKDTRPVYLKAFGMADFETKKENTTNTKFDIGSINKDFTSIAILQLAEKGLLNLDDKINKYLNQFPKDVLDKVTIRQLLTHTSGFGDYFMIPGVIPKLPELTTVDQIISTFKDEPLLFEPGTDRQYSNAGFAVLGAVIESIFGMSYFDYVDKNIVAPLKMNNTYFDYQKIRVDKDIPAGYMFSSTGRKERIDYEKSPSPAGSAFSTADDLLKFELSILNDNKLLNDEMKVLFANRYKNSSSVSWEKMLKDSAFISAYAGGAPGRNSVVYSQPATGYIIIVLANYDEPVAEEVGNNIYKLLADKEIIKPAPNVFRKLYLAYAKNGSKYLKTNFNDIIKDSFFEMEEDFLLNRVGYDLLNEKRLKDAIEVFKVNTELFPGIANTWDSLAEAYAADVQKELAIKFYQKAIHINPQSPAADNSRRMLEKLGLEK
jgi:CubicO group peptidase (beta-lactamase class C family)